MSGPFSESSNASVSSVRDRAETLTGAELEARFRKLQKQAKHIKTVAELERIVLSFPANARDRATTIALSLMKISKKSK